MWCKRINTQVLRYQLPTRHLNLDLGMIRLLVYATLIYSHTRYDEFAHSRTEECSMW